VWVNATGNWPYFVDDIDRITWIRRLVRMLDRNEWHCVAFCQMTTHVHLLVEVADDSLPLGMEYLNREYSKDFNDRHGRVGRFIRQRYGSRRIVDGRDLLGAYAYVVLNPVREGMCTSAQDWFWSSYATTIGARKAFGFVDADVVLGELDGSVAALERLVEHRAARSVSFRHIR
jgi:putative transposase